MNVCCLTRVQNYAASIVCEEDANNSGASVMKDGLERLAIRSAATVAVPNTASATTERALVNKAGTDGTALSVNIYCLV